MRVYVTLVVFLLVGFISLSKSSAEQYDTDARFEGETSVAKILYALPEVSNWLTAKSLATGKVARVKFVDVGTVTEEDGCRIDVTANSRDPLSQDSLSFKRKGPCPKF